MRIAVLDDYGDVARGLPCWGGLDVSFFGDHVEDEDALVERLRGFAGVVVMRERTPFPASLLRRLPDLRLLVTTGMANAAIDLAAAGHVTVCGTRMMAHPAAELAWGLVLELARGVGRADAAVRSGRWTGVPGVSLAGATLGLVGLGRLGARVARYGGAFDMDVVGWSPSGRPTGGVRVMSKEDVVERADFLSVHVRLPPGAEPVIGAAELRRMKPGAFLVNTSRAAAVDEGALVRALREGWIAGAGLDVFSREPLPDGHPVLSAPNTVLTPHLGYVTADNITAAYEDAAEAVRAYLDGAPIRVIR